MLVFNMTKKKKYILGILVLTIILVIVGIDLFNRFVKEETYEEGTYFRDNFDTNKRDWDFYHNGESKPTAANIKTVDGNKVLRAKGPYLAKINKELNDYSLKFRFKRIEGSMIVNFREYRSEEENSQYFIGLGGDKGTAINFSKQINANFNLASLRVEFDHYMDWHTLEIRVLDNIINVYLDDNFLIKYKDVENPILSGSVSFSVIANSEYLIDDIEIKSVKKEDVVEEVACLYECCADEFYKTKTCSAGYVCYNNICESKDKEVELLKDTKFEWGLGEFTESNLPQAQWCEMPIQEEPAWAVSEIATETHLCQNLPNPKSTEPTIIFESKGGYKKLFSYKDGRIKLQFDTSAEEKEGCIITNYKRSPPASSWPLYGVKQQISVDFTDFEELNFSLDVKLNKFEPSIYEQKCTKYGAKIDRYGEFLIVFLLKSKGEGYGPNNLYWLLINSCSKHWWSGAYNRGESGNKECTSNSTEYIMGDDFGIPMYHSAMDNNIMFSVNNTHPILKEGQWVSYNVDLKKFAEDGINYYNIKYGTDLDSNDYELAHIDLAWEIIGAFDTEIELRNPSLKGKFADD